MAEDSGLDWSERRVVTTVEELSKLVAIHVFDAPVRPWSGEIPGEIVNYAAGESIWNVVEKCLSEGVQLSLAPSKGDYIVHVEPFKPRERRNGAWSKTGTFSVSAPTAPIADCLAALWAVGVEVEYRPERELPKVGEVWDYVDNGRVEVLMVEPVSAAFPLGAVVCRPFLGMASRDLLLRLGSVWLVTTERFLDSAKKLYDNPKEA